MVDQKDLLQKKRSFRVRSIRLVNGYTLDEFNADGYQNVKMIY